MIKEEMWKRMHQPIPAREVAEAGRPGLFQLHAVPANGRALHVFRHHAGCPGVSGLVHA